MDRVVAPRERIMNWAAVAVWMTVIFFFSTDAFSAAHTTPMFAPLLATLFPGLTEEYLAYIAIFIRKFGHWSEYFILAVLLTRALAHPAGSEAAKRRMLWSVAFATLYAMSDEWHQSFVPSRSASPADVALDGVGAICGAFWFHWWNRRSKIISGLNRKQKGAIGRPSG